MRANEACRITEAWRKDCGNGGPDQLSCLDETTGRLLPKYGAETLNKQPARFSYQGNRILGTSERRLACPLRTDGARKGRMGVWERGRAPPSPSCIDQERLWSNGWGMKRPAENKEATPNTLYSVYSISKLFTSVAAMTLWEEGKLELNDRVGEHLSWFALEERQSGLPLTLESLLTHSSGLPRESDYPYWSPPNFDFPDRQEIREWIHSQRSLYPSQRYFQYSNLGLTLVGRIVAATSDTTYAAYVQDEVLAPLNLASTSPSLPWDSERMATGFSATTRSGDRAPVPSFQADGLAPAAGYASSVLDLTELASWQFRLLEEGGEEVLKAPTLQKMHNVHWADPDWDVHWGLGFSVWQADGETYVGHGGSCPGFRSHLALRPDTKLGAGFAANANGTDRRKAISGAFRGRLASLSCVGPTCPFLWSDAGRSTSRHPLSTSRSR